MTLGNKFVMKRSSIGQKLTGCVVVSLIALLLALSLLTGKPNEWEGIAIGIERQTVLLRIGEPSGHAVGISGYKEGWISEPCSFRTISGRWQLFLSFDEQNRVSMRQIYFEPNEGSKWNQLIPEWAHLWVLQAAHIRTESNQEAQQD